MQPKNMMRRSRSGFTLVEIMITVAIIGIILGLALPNFLKSRTNAQKQVCIENLSQIESAKQIWGVEHSKKEGDPVTQADLIGTSSYIKKMPVCPAAGSYDFRFVGENATCTIGGHSL